MPPIENLNLKMTIADADIVSKILLPKLIECTNKKCKMNMAVSKYVKYEDRCYQCRLSEISINKDGKCNDYEEIQE